jgi:hypothetical protein
MCYPNCVSDTVHDVKRLMSGMTCTCSITVDYTRLDSLRCCCCC